MINFRALSVVAGLALAGISIAHADTTLTGAWKLAFGSAAPCSLTLTADASPTAGTAAPGSDCTGAAADIGHWKARGNSIQLMTPAGDIVAWLKPSGDAYAGSRVDDGRKVALTR